MKTFALAVFGICALTQNAAVATNSSHNPNCTIVTEGFCIPNDYNKHQQPNPKETTNVQVKFTVEQITSVNDNDFTISLNMFLSLYWRDDRLPYIGTNPNETKPADIPLSMEWAENIWLPDIYVRKMQDIKKPKILQQFGSIYVKNFSAATDTLIKLKQQYQFTIWCKMEFSDYPFDEQDCSFELGSYSHQSDAMVFSIYKFNDFLNDESATVLDYTATIERLDARNDTYGRGEKYSLVGFRIKLKRGYEPYVINYYMPSAIFVLVSWISFLIPPDVIPGRMGLLITLLLVLINLFNSIKSPPAASPSALAIWILTCIIFVTFALLAYASLLYLKTSLTKRSMNAVVDVKSVFETRDFKNSPVKTQSNCLTQEQLDKKLTRLDHLFLMIFPVIFLLFNLIYWPYIQVFMQAATQ